MAIMNMTSWQGILTKALWNQLYCHFSLSQEELGASQLLGDFTGLNNPQFKLFCYGIHSSKTPFVLNFLYKQEFATDSMA